MVLGGHGDTMVPLPRYTKVSGKSIETLISKGKISKERLNQIKLGELLDIFFDKTKRKSRNPVLKFDVFLLNYQALTVLP